MWWESENSEPQSHGVTQTFLVQGETEKYSKEKSTMSSRFMNSKCPFAFKEPSGNGFLL